MPLDVLKNLSLALSRSPHSLPSHTPRGRKKKRGAKTWNKRPCHGNWFFYQRYVINKLSQCFSWSENLQVTGKQFPFGLCYWKVHYERILKHLHLLLLNLLQGWSGLSQMCYAKSQIQTKKLEDFTRKRKFNNVCCTQSLLHPSQECVPRRRAAIWGHTCCWSPRSRVRLEQRCFPGQAWARPGQPHQVPGEKPRDGWRLNIFKWQVPVSKTGNTVRQKITHWMS